MIDGLSNFYIAFLASAAVRDIVAVTIIAFVLKTLCTSIYCGLLWKSVNLLWFDSW